MSLLSKIKPEFWDHQIFERRSLPVSVQFQTDLVCSGFRDLRGGFGTPAVHGIHGLPGHAARCGIGDPFEDIAARIQHSKDPFLFSGGT
jgi:hypothetical protein